MLSRYNWSELSDERRREVLARPALNQDDDLVEATAAIINAVKAEGDKALRRFSRQLDKTDLESFKVSDQELEAAAAQLEQSQLHAIDAALGNIERFHRAQLSAPIAVETSPGVLCERQLRRCWR